MVFDGFKRIFNRIGSFTFDSSEKVGGGVQKVGGGVQKVTGGVQKVGKGSRSTFGKVGKIRPGRGKSSRGEGKLFKSDSSSKSAQSPRTIKKMKMDKDEIDIFRNLIDEKYERKEATPEKDSKKAAVQKASLEEILKEEEKPALDPKLILGIGVIAFAIVFVAVVGLGFGIEIGLVFGILILLMSMFIVYLPKIQKGGRNTAASRELPFALRQMSTELRAGIGLHDSMRSIAMSGYGPLSEEFARALEEIKYGETTEKALVDMSERINSEGLTRAIHQITRTLSSGGDLAKTLNVIAEDAAYEMRMKLKDYAQKLNAFSMIYMFVAIMGPVICMIMLIAASTVMGPIVPPILLLILYLFLFPAIVAFLAFMIKRLEPKM